MHHLVSHRYLAFQFLIQGPCIWHLRYRGLTSRFKPREVVSCTTNDHDSLLLRIEAATTEISAKAKADTALSQRQGPRTNELDQKLSVFEPEPEPYGVLPGIEEVLFSPVNSAINVRLEQEEVEGNQDEDICGIGDEQSQEEVSRQKVSENVPIEKAVTMVNDSHEPVSIIEDSPRYAHEPKQHDYDGANVPTATDKELEALNGTGKDNEEQSDANNDAPAIAAPEQQTEATEGSPQEREIIADVTNSPNTADNEKEELYECAQYNQKEFGIFDNAAAIAAPTRQAGPVEVSPQKREIIIDNGDKVISGRYPLFDLLSLSTTSGSISVAVVPQLADPMNPDEPARLRIQSQSGNVFVCFTAPVEAFSPEMRTQVEMIERAEYGNGNRYDNPHTLPLRPYEIEIESDSGTISGRFLVSTSVHLSTKSGSINTTFIPIASDTVQNVCILTQTTSGSQQIHLTDPVYMYSSRRDGSSSTTRAPAAHFSHGGGSMQIRYPPDWTGIVRAPPGSGSVSLVGQGMNVVRREDGSVEGCISGRGDWWGASGMDVSLGSRGAVMFYVG